MEEVAQCLRMLDEVYGVFGLQYAAALSTRPEKRMGTEEQWDKAEDALRHALEAVGKPFEVSYPHAMHGCCLCGHMPPRLCNPFSSHCMLHFMSSCLQQASRFKQMLCTCSCLISQGSFGKHCTAMRCGHSL